jgi:hypothetical protein
MGAETCLSGSAASCVSGSDSGAGETLFPRTAAFQRLRSNCLRRFLVSTPSGSLASIFPGQARAVELDDRAHPVVVVQSRQPLAKRPLPASGENEHSL